MFGEAKDIIFQHIDQVILQEQSMYSDQYKVAGRCDFIGLWDNEVAVVDFKTTTTPKKREWIEDYFVQCAAYASMYEEWTQETIKELVILMVAEDGHVDIFQEKTIDYLPKLEEMMDQYYTDIVDTINAN
jgi:genome maintenance exonuclease 1